MEAILTGGKAWTKIKNRLNHQRAETGQV